MSRNVGWRICRMSWVQSWSSRASQRASIRSGWDSWELPGALFRQTAAWHSLANEWSLVGKRVVTRLPVVTRWQTSGLALVGGLTRRRHGLPHVGKRACEFVLSKRPAHAPAGPLGPCILVRGSTAGRAGCPPRILASGVTHAGSAASSPNEAQRQTCLPAGPGYGLGG